MKFYTDGIFYKAVRITGPAHNYLSLAFADNTPLDSIKIERTNSTSSGLDECVIVRNIVEGVAEANERFAAAFKISTIQYAGDDSPPEEIYKYLAMEIVGRLANKKEFISISKP